MSLGFSFCNFSNEKPSLSSAPGRKFSVRTSAPRTSFNTSSRPSGRDRSTARLFLLRLKTGKKPAPAASSRRVLSPCRGSTFMTSAPRSASTRPHDGPITMCANSTTRTPSSGSTKSFWQAGERGMAVDRLFRDSTDEELPRLEQLVEIDAGRHAHALEHEHQVLGDHVAARAGRERAAAEPAHRAVEGAHADVIRRERVGEAQSAGIVEMRRLELVAYLLLHPREDALHLRRVRVADRVGERHGVAEAGERLRKPHDFLLRHFALPGAAERGG